MRFFEAPDGHDEPTVWVAWENPLGHVTEAVIQRCKLSPAIRHHWPHIVLCLTAGPTIESARVVIEALKDEIEALREANSELWCANGDLNRELTDLRRAHG